jgi:hypothetical protein
MIASLIASRPRPRAARQRSCVEVTHRRCKSGAAMGCSAVPARCLWDRRDRRGRLLGDPAGGRGYYIGHVLKRTTGTYAQFGLVIGAADLASRRRPDDPLTPPRSTSWLPAACGHLLGPPAAPADEQTLRALAKSRGAPRHRADRCRVQARRVSLGRPRAEAPGAAQYSREMLTLELVVQRPDWMGALQVALRRPPGVRERRTRGGPVGSIV